MKSLARCIASLLGLLLVASLAAGQDTGCFRVRFDEATFTSDFSGDVLVAFAHSGEPREAMHAWFGAPPVMRFTARDVAGGDALELTHAEAGATYPFDWSTVETGAWSVQAVARLSRTGRRAGLDAGDVFSDVLSVDYAPGADGVVELVLNHVVKAAPFEETDRVRLFEFVSPALSEFHGFDYTMQAGVLLPRTYGDRETYPVLYSVTGFGGTHEDIYGWQGRIPEGSALDECIIVIPDATNRYGHSVFCDSASIGPWGEALVRELIPALEDEYGGVGAEQRYVTGVSSGGWSSLWLQVAYPNDFAGCWSHVPDPIDFHDVQQINLYEPNADGTPRNMYVDENGEPRPVARRNGEVLLTYEEFTRREHVLNPGGQIRSFEATFSPPNDDGTPRRVFDIETGEIDHDAAQAWRKYDISNLLLTRWDELREPLAGKVHVYAGEVDTFYLEGAVERFIVKARETGILDEMVVEVIPGMTHSLHQPGHEAMARTIAERQAQLGGDAPQ